MIFLKFPKNFTLILQSTLAILRKACYAYFAKLTLQNGGAFLKTKIRELRREQKLSQEELAMAVGTTRQTITSIETGKYIASLPLAYKIARYFGLKIEEVFGLADYVQGEDKK